MIERELLETALSATSEGVIIASIGANDQPSKIIYTNKAVETLTGYDSQSLVGSDCNLMARLTSDTTVTEQEITAALHAGESIRYTKQSNTKSGDFFWNDLCISPVLNNNTLTHFICVLHNINEQVLYQEKIELQNSLLEKKNSQLDNMATHDFLTQLYNRRLFDRELKRLCAFHQRYQTPLSLAFLDIDYFKEYNDFYGHSAGDDALRLVANQINDDFSREADICARYGGEEFVVLSASDSDESTFLKHVDAVRLRIEELAIPHEKSKTSDVITVSAGIYVGVPMRGVSPTYFTEEADRAMYEAKHGGRNQVAVARQMRLISG